MKQSLLLILVALFLLSSCTKKPEASFTSSNTTIYEGETVTFTNTSTDEESVVWSFGDGSMSTENTVIKKFNNADTYSVTLNAYSKNWKASSSSVGTVTVEKAMMKLFVGSDTLIMTINNTLIYHSSSKNLNSCGNGDNTGVYSTNLEHENGKWIDISKGTLTWTCANPAPNSDFMAFFPLTSTYYSPEAANGMEIRYFNGSEIYSTGQGSADQTGSHFVVTSVTDEEILGSYYLRVSGNFTCKVYSSSGAQLQISGTFNGVPFENM